MWLKMRYSNYLENMIPSNKHWKNHLLYIKVQASSSLEPLQHRTKYQDGLERSKRNQKELWTVILKDSYREGDKDVK